MSRKETAGREFKDGELVLGIAYATPPPAPLVPDTDDQMQSLIDQPTYVIPDTPPEES